jgi:hypothetical protein
MKNFQCKCKSREDWIKSLDSFKMKNLVFTILSNARIQRKVVKYRLASERAEVIFGSKDACKIIDFQAESHLKRLESGVQKQLGIYRNFLEEMKQHEKQWTNFIESDQTTKHFHYVRDSILLQALYTEGKSKDAEKLIKDYDATINEIKALKSIESVQEYVHTLFTNTFWQIDLSEFWWKLCVVLRREFFAAMVLAWLFYCLLAAFTPNPEVTCTEWWDNLVWDVCGVPPGDFDWEWFQDVLEAS